MYKEKVHIENVDQKMLDGIYWANFFNNPENKRNIWLGLYVLMSKQIRIERYLRVHWSSLEVKMYADLVKKQFKCSQYQIIKKLTQG